MRLPRFTTSLHFRVSALFLGLLALFVGGYYLWIEATVLRIESAPGEGEWYDKFAEAEIDSLATALAPLLDSPQALDGLLVGYRERIEMYDAELALLAADGSLMASTRPDSLSLVLVRVSPALLDRMASPGWDFDSYPNPYDIDAFENRIFAVSTVRSASAPHVVRAYLVGSFRPLSIKQGEVARWGRNLALQAAVAILFFTALVFLIMSAFVSRRIRAIQRGMERFREGDLESRVASHSADEVGQLARGFNQMADRLSETIGKLRQSEEFHRQLIANISHDLRTPLTSLRGYVETLTLKDRPLPPEKREFALSVIDSNLDLLENLVARMLELSRLDAGQAEFRPEAFSLEELTGEVLARCEAIAAARGVTLACRVSGPSTEVHADPLRIGQVLQNLVENGIKFNRPSGSVEVDLVGTSDQVAVRVEDTGCGIAAEELPRVFDRFYSGDASRSGRNHGSGLGLAIAQRILEGHRSKLLVSSRPGEGTVFSFTLPRATESA